MMGVLFALVPVTLLVVLGYFVFFAANRAEGSAKTFGKYLGIWVFILAGLILLTAAIAPRLGFGPHVYGFSHHGFSGRFGGREPGFQRFRRPPPPPQGNDSQQAPAEPAPAPPSN